MVEKDGLRLVGHRAIGVLVAVGHREQEAVGIAHRSAEPFLDERFEAGNDHPLPVEGHGLAHLGHPGIAHHLLVRGVARGAVAIFEPAEDDLLAFLCLYRRTAIVELARGDLVTPRPAVAAHPEPTGRTYDREKI